MRLGVVSWVDAAALHALARYNVVAMLYCPGNVESVRRKFIDVCASGVRRTSRSA